MNSITGKGDTSGFFYQKEYETDTGYVYAVTTGSAVHYECFRRKSVPVCIDFEKRIYSEVETKEVYPKKEDFGKWAWVFGRLESAISKLEMLETQKGAEAP